MPQEPVSIHAPTGGRPRDEANARLRELVSIHAPTGGRPGKLRIAAFSVTGFNPRPHGGATQLSTSMVDQAVWFQSTPPRGGDP